MAITLEEARANIRRAVRYDKTGEYGEISSVGERFVFVQYAGDFGSKATAPEDLHWMVPHDDDTYRTKTGKVLTAADIDELAAEAERGYDVTKMEPLPPRDTETVDLIGALRRSVEAAQARRAAAKEAE